MTDACLATCDAAGNSSTVTAARAILACLVQSGCGDDSCVDEVCATEVSACGQTAGTGDDGVDDYGRRARNTNAPPSRSSS